MAGDPARNNRKRTERFVRNFQENGIQALLEHPGNVRDLLSLTGEALVAEIDLHRMHLVRSTFITRDYRRRAADVVLVAPFREGHPDRRLIITVLLFTFASFRVFRSSGLLEAHTLIPRGRSCHAPRIMAPAWTE